jgi:uncharacterized membrane protein
MPEESHSMPVQRTLKHIGRTLLTGTLAVLPLAATLFLVVWLLRTLHAYLGPSSLVGRGLMALGLDVVESDLASWLLGLGLVLAAVYLLGLLVQTRLKRWWHGLVDGLLGRIPGVRQVYELVRKFVDMLQQRDQQSTRSMSPVWLHFGGIGHGARVLGLLSTAEPVQMDGQPCLAVLVPTAPVPVGGALIFVPQAWVQPAAIGIEALTSIYVSMGVTTSQHLGMATVTSRQTS